MTYTSTPVSDKVLLALLNQMSQDGLFALNNPREPLGYSANATSKDIYFTLKNGVIGLISLKMWWLTLECLVAVEPEDIPRLLALSDHVTEFEALFPDFNKKGRKPNHIACLLGYMNRLLIQYYLRNRLEERSMV